MPRPSQDVTEAERAVLEVLWDRGRATVRELTEVLYLQRTASSQATVLKLLERLETKNCVLRNRDVWPHVFEATVSRENLVQRRLQATADELCGGSWAPLLTHLVRSTRLSREERDSLREVLEELDRESGKKKK